MVAMGNSTAEDIKNQIEADGVVLDLFPKIKWGNGSPEGAVVADVGTLYLRLDGGAATTLYVKEANSTNVGWAAK